MGDVVQQAGIFERLAEWGAAFTPEVIERTGALFAPLAPRPDEACVVRNVAYGPDERHRLDVFAAEGTKGAPVLLFVHGGGFVMGDKGGLDAPFYNNIGAFAMEKGFVGATMTYRLAPAHCWPAGRDDVLAACRWLSDHAADHGGDPQRIYVMGQSAGAVHVADAVARNDGERLIAGAIMISGMYDIAMADRNDFQRAYYGRDEKTWAECSSIQRLAETTTPCFFSVSEFDPPDFQRQASAMVDAFVAAHSHWPEMHYLTGHNHLSSVYQLGGEADTLGPRISDFVKRRS